VLAGAIALCWLGQLVYTRWFKVSAQALEEAACANRGRNPRLTPEQLQMLSSFIVDQHAEVQVSRLNA
jgi:hypothetical protein